MCGLVEYEIFNFSGSLAEFGWRCQVIRKKTFACLCSVRFLLALELFLQIPKEESYLNITIVLK